MENTPKDFYIYYIGKDEAWWKSLQDRYSVDYPDKNIGFNRIWGATSQDRYLLYLEILYCKAHIIYIDFSSEPEDILYLAKLISREDTLNEIPFIGVLNYLTDEELTMKAFTSGVDHLFVKSGELHDAIYCPMFKRNERGAKSPIFAVGKFSETTFVREVFRVGYVSATLMRIEGCTRFDIGKYIRIENDIFSRSILPSNLFIVGDIQTTNLYYDYPYALEAKFVYQETGLEDTNIGPKKLHMGDASKSKVSDEEEQKKAEEEIDHAQIEAEKEYSQKKIKAWVDDYGDVSSAKHTKILIVSHKMDILKEADRPLNTYDFSIRLKSTLVDAFETLDKLRPHIICYTLETPEKDEGIIDDAVEKDSYNDIATLKQIVHDVCKIENYSPYIIVFEATGQTSEKLQEKLGYLQIMAQPGVMNLETTLKMATIFETKLDEVEKVKLNDKVRQLKAADPGRYRNLTASALMENRVFFSNKDPRSWVYYSHQITILAVSESEIFFMADYEMSMEGIYKFEVPFPMFVKLIPHRPNNELGRMKNCYRGIFQMIGEKEKKELRKFVNSVYTKAKTEKREEEIENFKAKNEEVWTQIIAEKEQKELEAAQAEQSENDGDSQESTEERAPETPQDSENS